jgi:Spy/CpxP family protein refolding chaperone
MVILRRLLLTILVVLAVPAFAQNPTTTTANADMEMLMQKIKADRKLLVAANMDLTDAEAKQFWPLYDAYQKELEQINEHLGRTIKEYAEALDKGPIPDDTADEIDE